MRHTGAGWEDATFSAAAASRSTSPLSTSSGRSPLMLARVFRQQADHFPLPLSQVDAAATVAGQGAFACRLETTGLCRAEKGGLPKQRWKYIRQKKHQATNAGRKDDARATAERRLSREHK